MFRSIEFLAKTALCACLSVMLGAAVFAQVKTTAKGTIAQTINGPKVTQIDIAALKKLIKPNGKPLLVNFWATWCDPCREEFPDLVKANAAYRGKVDFITISLDDLVDKDTTVPKFLTEMKAEMPTYLLITPDEDAAMKAVTPEWAGNLPMTILFAADGSTAYLRKGKIRADALNPEIDKLLSPSKPAN